MKKIRYYFANWKMFQSFSAVKKFTKQALRDDLFLHPDKNTYIGIAASYEHLYYVEQKLKKSAVHVGAQDCSNVIAGPYTGQVSVQSLSELNLSFCIIGHSEVRQYLGQSNELIALKFKLLLAANISPIFCIGQTLAQQQAGFTCQVLFDQLEAILDTLSSYHGTTKIFIAYEPIYAIGSGILPKTEELQEVFSFLQSLFVQLPIAKNVMFLYGGSVCDAALPQLAEIKGISGFLIGKASIDFQELKKIVESK